VIWKSTVSQVRYLIPRSTQPRGLPDDDEAESGPTLQSTTDRADRSNGKKEKKAKNRGQNKNRHHLLPRDTVVLCLSRHLSSEFSAKDCSFGDKCKNEHDLRKYMASKAPDLETLGGKCPPFEERGYCPSGWTCRFVWSHAKEVTHEDGRTELVLLEDEEKKGKFVGTPGEFTFGAVNVVEKARKIDLNRKRVEFKRSEEYVNWLSNVFGPDVVRENNQRKEGEEEGTSEDEKIQDNRATYVDPPFLPSEKRRLYYGPETPIVAPLTTQGNLPFRRLCVSLGAQVTFSEMAMSTPLLQGAAPEWALMKAHCDEMTPPTVSSKASEFVQGYENAKDIRFGVQISASKPWQALKATEVIAKYCDNVRAIDMNCGCPIDLVWKQGAGAKLLDSPPRLEKMLRGMNALSGEIPITCKLRTGTRDGKPNAKQLVSRLLLGSKENRTRGLGGCGVAAVTLHGRSRAQRYARLADWNYIAEVAETVKHIRNKEYDLTDTANEVDERYKPNGNGGHVLFVGNGDVYSHTDYFSQLEHSKTDSVMIGRGALIKPWIFKEIEARQYLDPSPSERLEYVKDFVKYGLAHWGSDEKGVGNTRRFLLEWLSFTYRYVPVGLLEVLPAKLNDRPPAFKGRDEMETLLASGNYKDWIKISEIFLGKAGDDFRFTPKHKSNSYEIEAEG
jgi:tRNA-dihydrouridine synthase 3